jgi:hypothetical protein
MEGQLARWAGPHQGEVAVHGFGDELRVESHHVEEREAEVVFDGVRRGRLSLRPLSSIRACMVWALDSRGAICSTICFVAVIAARSGAGR